MSSDIVISDDVLTQASILEEQIKELGRVTKWFEDISIKYFLESSDNPAYSGKASVDIQLFMEGAQKNTEKLLGLYGMAFQYLINTLMLQMEKDTQLANQIQQETSKF